MAYIHAVLGPGGDDVPDSVIKDGLKDLLEKGDSLALPWYGPPSDSLEAVYDYVLDNEVPFTMFYTGRKPPTVFETDGELSETKDIHKSLAQMASPDSKALVLFPEHDISEDVFGFLDYAPAGVQVLDLSNGLVPVEVNDDDEDSPEEVEAEAEETSDDEDSLAGFTREERQGLSLKLLKRAAANVAPDVVIESTEQAINLILGETQVEEGLALDNVPSDEVLHTEHPAVVEAIAKSADTLLVQALEALRKEESSRQNSLAITKVEEAILWRGGVV